MNWLIKYRIKYATLVDKINLLERKYNIPKNILNQLTQLDPTTTKSYLEWITKQYKSNDRILSEDKEKFLEILAIFDSKKSLMKRKGLSIDINSYSSLGDLTKTIQENNIAELVSNNEKIRINEREGQKIVLNQGIWTIVSILTPEASSVLCKGTSWCVKDPKYFNRYNISSANPLYLILKNNERYALWNEKSYQLMNIYDRRLSYEQVKELEPILKQIDPNFISLTYFNVDSKEFKLALKAMPFEEIKKSARLSYYYCLYINGPTKELEPVIATNPFTSFYYAEEVLKGRPFLLGEKVIATNAQYSYFYAIYILKERFKLGESTIKNSAFNEHYEKYFNIEL